MGEALITKRGSNKNENYKITFKTTTTDGDNAQPYSDKRSVVKKFDISAIKNKFSHIYVSGGVNGGDTIHRGIFSMLENKFLLSYSALGDDNYFDAQYIYRYNTSYLGFEIIDDYLICFVQGGNQSSVTNNHLFNLEFM